MIPALQALAPVGEWLAEWGCVWGPTGAVGFELASGWPATTVASDLDILIRSPLRLERAPARAMLRGLQRTPVRVDLQLDTPAGLVALAEYAAGGREVLVRGEEGVRLVEDPWAIGWDRAEPRRS
jgi:phosphoribosyl-dephospho-CoA transferase